MIEKHEANGKEVYEVESKDGKKSLGTYSSKKKAIERLHQVEAFKHMKEDEKESPKSVRASSVAFGK
jgi:hypothetical protein